jgi:hypothetical protein
LGKFLVTALAGSVAGLGFALVADAGVASASPSCSPR